MIQSTYLALLLLPIGVIRSVLVYNAHRTTGTGQCSPGLDNACNVQLEDETAKAPLTSTPYINWQSPSGCVKPDT